MSISLLEFDRWLVHQHRIKVGNGKYNMSPQSGNEVVISVSGKMSDGNSYRQRMYRIKGIQAQQELLEEKLESLRGLNQPRDSYNWC
jgi:hypothetical protein